MTSSYDYYDCSPENVQGSVLSGNAKDTINNIKIGFTYVLSIGVNIAIIYSIIYLITKMLCPEGRETCKDNIGRSNTVSLLFMLIPFLINIYMFLFGSIYKIFHLKTIGLSGILVSIIYFILYIIFNVTSKTVIFPNFSNDVVLIGRIIIIIISILVLLITLVNVKGSPMHSKKNNKRNVKFSNIWFPIGISVCIILYLMLSTMFPKVKNNPLT